MRCLVTGASGFVGAWLVKRLTARGDLVRCLLRGGSSVSALDGLAYERAEGDITAPATLPSALEGVEVVFHLAGIRRAARREEFIEVNAEGTRNVCEAMKRSGARRLVLCGSLAAAGPSTLERPRREDDALAPEEWYGESKAEAEVIAFGYGRDFEVTSIRPSRILGPGDRENLAFFRLVKKGIVLKLGGPRRPLSMVDVEDVVTQLILQAERPEAVGEAFFASSEETTSLTELMQHIAEYIGVKARVVPLPEGVLRALAGAADLVSTVSGRRLPLNRKLARQLLAPGWTCSIEKAKSRLGYRPAWTLEASIKRSADSYQALGWI
ncbi:MAG: NAD-dependent epimerase/dehydratase family protein [Myxococcaceae bacterium]|nr:NAD-dependent epimerase/dehydratase family protein [Myxococcaceae bacterium]